jgi:hypothetical protein
LRRRFQRLGVAEPLRVGLRRGREPLDLGPQRVAAAANSFCRASFA